MVASFPRGHGQPRNRYILRHCTSTSERGPCLCRVCASSLLPRARKWFLHPKTLYKETIFHNATFFIFVSIQSFNPPPLGSSYPAFFIVDHVLQPLRLHQLRRVAQGRGGEGDEGHRRVCAAIP